jgi:FAD/FMN-containing dehydrogenase
MSLVSYIGAIPWEHPQAQKKRFRRIIKQILSQCSPRADPLFAKYSFDIICLAYNTFLQKGLTLPHLLKFQEVVPTVYPWNIQYDSLRQDVNRRFNIFPLMIVLARTDRDVIRALKFARKYHIMICMRSGAHSYEGFSLCDGMVIDQRYRTQVCLNESKDRVTLEAGVLLGPLADELFKCHRFLQAGTCSNNGATGLTLGGGIGFATRKYGVTSDSLREVKMVLANGDLVTANATENVDLYWASRGGGGGNFGIVTSLTFDVHPVDKVVIFQLTYGFEVLKQVLDVWQRTYPFSPDNLTAELDIFSPTSADVMQSLSPEFNFGVPQRKVPHTSSNANDDSARQLIVTGMYLGPEEELVKLLEPVLHIDTPIIDIRTVPYVEAARFFSGKAHRLPFFKGKSAFFKQFLPPEALDIVEHFMLIAPTNSKMELDAQGGAVNRIPPEETAYVHRDTLWWTQFLTFWRNEQERAVHLQWITDFYNALRPYFPEPDYAYVNIIDREIVDYMEAYYGINKFRLVDVKKKYDPENIFHFAQSIPLALP